MLTRRTLLGAAAGAAGALALPRGARAAGAISVGYIPDFPNGSVLAIAQDQKLWDAEGLTPDIKTFTNGPIQIQAMGAGSLDVGTIGPGALWLPASGRAKVIGVNDIGFSDRVIAQPGIGSIADLKGRKVAVPQGTSGDMILRLGLAKGGLAVTDVELIPMDPSTIVAAFSSGQVDAAGLWYPLVDVLKGRVPGLKELASDQDFYPQTSFINTYVARNELVASNPELVKSFLRVMKKANDYRLANLDRSIEITAAFIGQPAGPVGNNAHERKILSSAQLEAYTKDGTVNGWLTQFNRLFQQFGTVKDPLPPEQYYTGELYTSA